MTLHKGTRNEKAIDHECLVVIYTLRVSSDNKIAMNHASYTSYMLSPDGEKSSLPFEILCGQSERRGTRPTERRAAGWGNRKSTVKRIWGVRSDVIFSRNKMVTTLIYAST